MQIFLSILSLLFAISAVSASHQVVTVSFGDDQGERRLTTNQRFLEDVLVPVGTAVWPGCTACGGPYSDLGSDGTRSHTFIYNPSGTVTNVKATVYATCVGVYGAEIQLNGVSVGTNLDVTYGLDDCFCNQCTPFEVESSNQGLIDSINSGANTVTFVQPSGRMIINRVVFDFTIADAGGDGDPHFHTWKNEHFEFHGQCDIVMTSVKNFAGKGKDLAIHLRTKMVRYWSYIKTAAIRIGDDTLEVEGSADKEDGVNKLHYRINSEYRGELDTVGGYPVTISPRNNKYIIDLDKDYPGQKIEIKTFKEFVSVKVVGATEESFGSAVGITGDFKTGKTLARDGSTEIHDFNDLGLEWQVLPSDGKLFSEMTKPQFPELCYLPEDPRGERTRRLAESNITEEAAEKACAGLKDELDRKDCVYDILATQDLDMVGAF